jgi:transposase
MGASRAVEGVRVNRTGRRTYTAEYKQAVVRECRQPGVSVSAIALAHGINANLLRKWLRRQPSTLPKVPTQSAPVLLPVTIDATTAASPVTGTLTSRTQRRAGVVGIEIDVYGARIQVRGVVEVEALRNVLSALSSR